MDPRRTRKPLTLSTNPLVFALGQVVISPVLRMGDLIPDLQDRFRKAGFPRFSQMETRQVQLTGGKAEVVPDTRWVFADRDNQTGVVISTNFMVLEQTTYTTFDSFTELLAEAVAIVSEVVEVDLCERFGFRRVNLIEATDSGLTLREFFRAGLRGLNPADLEVDQLTARLEERGRTPVGQLVVRLLSPAPESGLPNDLAPTTLDRIPTPEHSDHALLDIDHYTETTSSFDAETVVEGFWQLHHHSDLAFRYAVTEEALSFWRGE